MLVCYKTGIFAGFPLHNINFAERNSEAAMGREGEADDIIFFRVQRSSLRVRRNSLRVRCSSVGCSVDCSEGCSVAQKGAA